MHIRKIAAAAGFACGAALAFAPLASADIAGTVTSTLDAEIAAQNSNFELDALLAGVSGDITKGGVGVYDHFTTPALLAQDAPQATTYDGVTPLESELYGANPILAGITSDTGPYSAYNGALTEFYDAYNVGVYAAANGGALDHNVADYLGSATTIGNAINAPGATVSSAEQYFYNFGVGDLKGYDAIFAPAQTAVAPTDINPTIGNEIVQLNQLYELDGRLAGADVYGDIAPHGSTLYGVGFDTIAPGDATPTFGSLVDGAAFPTGDSGSYDVLNGALGEFYNAFNVGDYALINNGALLPAFDVIGTHADFLTGGVSTAISDFLQQGFGDLAGYFVPAM
jgi:hypothetical protein